MDSENDFEKNILEFLYFNFDYVNSFWIPLKNLHESENFKSESIMDIKFWLNSLETKGYLRRIKDIDNIEVKLEGFLYFEENYAKDKKVYTEITIKFLTFLKGIQDGKINLFPGSGKQIGTYPFSKFYEKTEISSGDHKKLLLIISDIKGKYVRHDLCGWTSKAGLIFFGESEPFLTNKGMDLINKYQTSKDEKLLPTEIKRIYIDKKFSDYQLVDFDKFNELINICTNDSRLYRLIPFLLRTLFENILYFIFKDGLASKHTEFFFSKNQSRSRDFSELIALLSILKDCNDFKPFLNNLVTERTIDYLIKRRKDGNIDVHGIITQLKQNYPYEIQEEVILLLDSLLPLYNSVKGKNIEIQDQNTIERIHEKLNIKEKPKRVDHRKLIESIKIMAKEELGDLIVSTDYQVLYDLVSKALAEIILIEEYYEFKKKTQLFEFVLNSIKLRTKKDETLELFGIIISSLITSGGSFMKEIYLDVINLCQSLIYKNYIIENNLLDDFIQLFKNSYSYENATLNASFLYNFYSNFTKSQIDQIVKATIENDQIYNSYNAFEIIDDLFNNIKEKLTVAQKRDLYDIEIYF